MDNTLSSYTVPREMTIQRSTVSIILVMATLLLAACGGEAPKGTTAGMYPPGSKSEEDVFNELKFDSRVEDYETDGDKLVVNVDAVFESSPPGVQQRALGHWYNLWQAARGGEAGKKVEVVARSKGNDVAKWTAAEGYQLVARKKAEAESGTPVE